MPIEPDEVAIGLFMLHCPDEKVDLAQAIVEGYRDACRRGDVANASKWEGRLKSWLKERGENVD